MENKRIKVIAQYGAGILAVILMLYGTHRGEVEMVFNKAVNICLECIGLG